MDDKEFDKVNNVDLRKTMESAYIDYAMSVIASRALPDVRDGMKPVQRRILYSMIELNNTPDKPHRKSARIVGDTMGKYHPHGDSSIYGALVNMAQGWNMRYPLVDGHGNFGSIDGDGAAAMRYTEARLSKMSMELTKDLNKDTVDFEPNFDETEKEPVVLPARFPNLLVNGTTGIAVGMATNIPPHNLREVVDGITRIIDNNINEVETTDSELLEIIKGPDFPTGAKIHGTSGITSAYLTGRGKIKIRAIANIEVSSSNKTKIVITELPYMVNKARLVEKIAELARDKKIDGITGVSDFSDRDGNRVVVDIRRDANANVILNQLYKQTQMQETFGIINLALDHGEPKIMNLREMLNAYLTHQEEVVTRRCKFELNKAEERAHILSGLLIALDNIDRVIELIKGSDNTAQAKEALIKEFNLTDAQAQAIVDMRLRSLTGLERRKIEEELEELEKQILYLKAILGDRKKLLGLIKEEIIEIREKYGDDRKTSIEIDTGEIANEDLIQKKDIVITMTKQGYIKRMDPDNFKAQGRGGKGIKGMQTLEDDYIEEMFMMNSHEYIMFFTNKGRCYRLKGYEIPEASRISRGVAIVNLLQLMADEMVTAIIPFKAYSDNLYLLCATKKGLVKKTLLQDYSNVRKTGLAAIKLKEDDELISVKISSGDAVLLCTSKKGNLIKFSEKDIRETARNTSGVIAMRISKDDELISMQMDSQGKDMLLVSQKGIGKRTSIDEFHVQKRGGKGVRCYKISEKTGDLVGAILVEEENEIMIINTEGIIIRVRCSEISRIGRNTSGVRVIKLNGDDEVARVTKIKEEEIIE